MVPFRPCLMKVLCIRKMRNLIFLLWLFGVFCFSLIILHIHTPPVVIRCPCTEYAETDFKVYKYLPELMNKIDTETNASVRELIQDEHPYFPIEFLLNQEIGGKRCKLCPGLFSVKHNNIFWQEAHVGSTTFYLFSAILDERDVISGSLIRILAVANSPFPPSPTCQLYFGLNNSTVASTRATRLDFLHWDYPLPNQWYPFIITCQAGVDNRVADVVSVVDDPCSKDVSNALTLYKPPVVSPKESLALCTKFIYDQTHDFSIRLSEWIESCRAWGVSKITIYITQAHPNVDKVLDYYEEDGFVELRPWSNPATYPNIPSLLRAFYDTQRYALFTLENIPYTDCLLRNMNSHRYVAVWDLDEFILPVTHDSIPILLDESFNKWLSSHEENKHKKPPISYLARGTYYFDNVSDSSLSFADILNYKKMESSSWYGNLQNYHMLSHIKRTLKFTDLGVHTKAIHDTSVALGLHAHFAILDIDGAVNKEEDFYHWYPQNEGFLAHYRDKCQGDDQQICDEEYRPHLVVDHTMWKKGDFIYKRTQAVLEELELL